jgi:hypothetical protein
MICKLEVYVDSEEIRRIRETSQRWCSFALTDFRERWQIKHSRLFGGLTLVNWIVEMHPYTASLLLLLILFSIGYVESRVLSIGSACFTWLWIVIGASAALARVSAMGPLRWVLAALSLVCGSSWILHYYRRHRASGQDAK